MILIKGNVAYLQSIMKACRSHGAKASIKKLSFYGYDGFHYAELLGMDINDTIVQTTNLRSETLGMMPHVEHFIRV